MNLKNVGKGLKKLGKGKIAKELTEEVTEETLASVTNGLLEKNKQLINSVGNQWKKEVIDTAGALSHLPETKSVQGALRNKGESVLSKSPLRVIERTGKNRDGYDVIGISDYFNLEGVIKSKKSLANYLRAEVGDGPTNSYSLLKNNESFNSIARDIVDGGKEAPYWARIRAARNPRPTPQPTTRKYDSKRWSNGKPKHYTKKLKDGTTLKGYLDKDGVEVANVGTTKNGVRKVSRKRSIRQDAELRKRGIDYVEPNNTYLTSRYDPKSKKGAVSSKLYSEDKTIKKINYNTSPANNKSQVPKSQPDLGTNTKSIEPSKNRRRGNKAAKKAPVNSPAQQDPQLLLEAPKQKSPRREYKSDLGTNTEPIPLPGPVKELPKNDAQPKPPVESAPQSKPEPKNKQVDVSIDDFKPADEIDFDDDNEIDVTHLFEEEEPKKVKSRSEEYADKLDELETKYSNGDITDIEYAEEQQRLQDIFEKENPIDVSNVLSDQKEPPFNIDDFSMPNIDEVDINKTQWKNTEKEKLPKETPYTKSDTYDLNLKRESRYYLTESEYFDQVDRIEEMYNNGELTDQKYADELNRAKKDYVPELVDQANEETKQYIKDNLNQESLDPEIERLYVNPKDKKSVISKRNQGDYNANVTNGFVDDITVGDETYSFKYRNGEYKTEKERVIDIYDSNNNIITDKDLYNDILNKGREEKDNFYKNLSDEEWDTVINNAEDYRFTNNKGDLESNRKLRNQNDAITKRQQVLKEKSDNYQTEFENEKKKKKRKEIEKKRNNSEIDILQAEKLKKKNELKLEARNERQVAREAFQKKVKEEGLEKGTEAYNEALKDLKESFKNSEKTMEKRLASTNKNLNAQIKGWSGKGLTLKNAVTVGFSAKAAVDKYKEARAEGKSAGSAAIRAGASAVAAEVLGPLGSTALMAAQVAPKIAVEGANALYSEYRRMNSASNFVPLGGVNFQDSQELATMRQSGMELAKMAQYNLEQSLMGAEAKHLHR